MAAIAPAPTSERRLVARPVYFEDLLEGEPTRCDIYTCEGQLLVSKGTTLTPEIRAKVAKRRGFEMVPAIADKKCASAVPEPEDIGRLAHQVLAELESPATDRNNEVRQRVRRRLRARLEVRPLAVGQSAIVEVWARNLSEQGIGFIARVEILSERIIINLPKVSVTAEITRRRPVQKGFWEYGARFLGRLPNNLARHE